MRCYLGIDCGGTATKAALYTPDGTELAVESFDTQVHIPRPGFAERNMDTLRETVYRSIRRVVEKAGVPSEDVVCVACCGHGKGLYLWGKDDRPTRPAILSTDTRASDIVRQWREDGTQERAYRLSFQEVMGCQPVALLNWLRRNEPETLERTQWVFSCKDYVRFCLTGEAWAELTDFSGDNLVNLHTRDYDRELLACFGLEDMIGKLPPLRRTMDVCGGISPQAAEATGLRPGTPVAGGMFDIDACLLAVNAVSESQLCVIAGTWSINEYIRREPVTDGSVRMNSIFCDPDFYLVEESSATSAGNNEWFIRTLMPELRDQLREKNRSIYQACNEMVGSLRPAEFCPIFLPYLFDSNVHPDAKSCFVGMAGHHTRAHLVKGVYEGIVYCHKIHIDRLLRSRAVPVSAIRLAGGVARSPVWSQMFADATGLPVETVDVSETGALGCAIDAAVAVGDFASLWDAAAHMVHVKACYSPDSSLRDVYGARYEVYKSVTAALEPVWPSLVKLME